MKLSRFSILICGDLERQSIMATLSR